MLGVEAEAVLRQNQDEARRAGFEVYEENWPVVELFVRASTQWRMGMGGPVGLDYGGVALTARLTGVKLTREVFAGLQAMEAAALDELNRRARS